MLLYCINDSQKSACQLLSQSKQNWCTRPSSRFRDSMKIKAGLLSGWNILCVFWGIYSTDCWKSVSDVLFIALKSNYTVQVYFSNKLRKQSNNALMEDNFTDLMYVYIKINETRFIFDPSIQKLLIILLLKLFFLPGFPCQLFFETCIYSLQTMFAPSRVLRQLFSVAPSSAFLLFL